MNTEIDLVKPDGVVQVPTPAESIYDMLEHFTPTQTLSEMSEPKETTDDSKSFDYGEKSSGGSSESLQADKERHWSAESSDASCDGRLMLDSTRCVHLEADLHREKAPDVRETRGVRVSSPMLSKTTLQQLDASCLLDSEGYINISPMEKTSCNTVIVATYPCTVEGPRGLSSPGVTSDDEDYVTPAEDSSAKPTETTV